MCAPQNVEVTKIILVQVGKIQLQSGLNKDAGIALSLSLSLSLTFFHFQASLQLCMHGILCASPIVAEGAVGGYYFFNSLCILGCMATILTTAATYEALVALDPSDKCALADLVVAYSLFDVKEAEKFGIVPFCLLLSSSSCSSVLCSLYFSPQQIHLQAGHCSFRSPNP